jgi:hypothetical protein
VGSDLGESREEWSPIRQAVENVIADRIVQIGAVGGDVYLVVNDRHNSYASFYHSQVRPVLYGRRVDTGDRYSELSRAIVESYQPDEPASPSQLPARELDLTKRALEDLQQRFSRLNKRAAELEKENELLRRSTEHTGGALRPLGSIPARSLEIRRLRREGVEDEADALVLRIVTSLSLEDLSSLLLDLHLSRDADARSFDLALMGLNRKLTLEDVFSLLSILRAVGAREVSRELLSTTGLLRDVNDVLYLASWLMAENDQRHFAWLFANFGCRPHLVANLVELLEGFKAIEVPFAMMRSVLSWIATLCPPEQAFSALARLEELDSDEERWIFLASCTAFRPAKDVRLLSEWLRVSKRASDAKCLLVFAGANTDAKRLAELATELQSSRFSGESEGVLSGPGQLQPRADVAQAVSVLLGDGHKKYAAVCVAYAAYRCERVSDLTEIDAIIRGNCDDSISLDVRRQLWGQFFKVPRSADVILEVCVHVAAIGEQLIVKAILTCITMWADPAVIPLIIRSMSGEVRKTLLGYVVNSSHRYRSVPELVELVCGFARAALDEEGDSYLGLTSTNLANDPAKYVEFASLLKRRDMNAHLDRSIGMVGMRLPVDKLVGVVSMLDPGDSGRLIAYAAPSRSVGESLLLVDELRESGEGELAKQALYCMCRFREPEEVNDILREMVVVGNSSEDMELVLAGMAALRPADRFLQLLDVLENDRRLRLLNYLTVIGSIENAAVTYCAMSHQEALARLADFAEVRSPGEVQDLALELRKRGRHDLTSSLAET